MRLLIVKRPGDTHPLVLDEKTGQRLENVAAVSWTMDPSRTPHTVVEMVLHDVEIEVVADSGDPDTTVNVWSVKHDTA